MRTIHFHKSLHKYTNNIDKISIDVNTYYDLVKASIDLFEGLYKLFKQINLYHNAELALIVDGKLLSLDNLFLPAKGKIIKLVPLIKGSGRIGMIVAAVAIVALTIYTGGIALTPTLSVVGSSAGSIGAATITGTTITVTTFGQLALGIAASLFLAAIQPPPKPPRISSSTGGFRRDNDIFNGLANTTNSQIPVPLNYGEMRVSGQLLSGFIKTIDHGKNDIVKVVDQFES